MIDNFRAYAESTESNKKVESIIDKVSYAGGLVGIIDLSNPDSNNDITSSSGISPIRNLVMNGSTTRIIGEVVGGVAGYVGPESMISASITYAGRDTVLEGMRVSGGLVGHNEGEITRSFVSNSQEIQTSIDNALATLSNTVNQIYRDSEFANDDEKYTSVGSTTLFGSNAHYIGGLVGYAETVNISKCSSASEISSEIVCFDSTFAESFVAGLIGLANDSSSTISKSYFEGTISANKTAQSSNNYALLSNFTTSIEFETCFALLHDNILENSTAVLAIKISDHQLESLTIANSKSELLTLIETHLK